LKKAADQVSIPGKVFDEIPGDLYGQYFTEGSSIAIAGVGVCLSFADQPVSKPAVSLLSQLLAFRATGITATWQSTGLVLGVKALCALPSLV
jgi:hypothetical protein